ncbi:2-succinyl-6-hydroxy-2,4-cyclohexadiene-1-carboxylate synthase [Lactobacillus sp. XV13L]|nr:2-succinyl-6-hydroxy-2,4-cyclohexadiene-1-carboxylate synthase [Lactobacillus sp. XV13L]
MQLTINQAVYNINIEGQGQPVWLLLHGFMGSQHDFEQIKPYLTTTVITLDLLGHGKTKAPLTPSRLTFKQQTQDLAEILNTLHFSSVNICGYSMGGRLALGLALSFPQFCRQLFLENCTAGIINSQKRKQRQQHDQFLAQKLRQEPLSAFIHYWEQLPLFQSQKTLSPAIQQQIYQQRIQQNPQGLAASLEGMGTGVMPNYWPQLEKFFLPVTLITGNLDTKFSQITQQMHQLFPHSQRFVVDQAGHNVHLEQPQVYSQILKEQQYAN